MLQAESYFSNLFTYQEIQRLRLSYGKLPNFRMLGMNKVVVFARLNHTRDPKDQ